MVTNNQVRLLMKKLAEGKTLTIAAAKSGMSEKTARKYRDLGKLPSECKKEHSWVTRKDPFAGVFSEIEEFLESDEKVEVKTLFEYLQDKYIKAVIIPIEYPNWILPGLQMQILRQFDKNNIQVAFPKPFCSLNKKEDEYNKINFNITKKRNYINEFIDYFQIGKPKVLFILENN